MAPSDAKGRTRFLGYRNPALLEPVAETTASLSGSAPTCTACAGLPCLRPLRDDYFSHEIVISPSSVPSTAWRGLPHQAHDIELLHDAGKRRTRPRA